MCATTVVEMYCAILVASVILGSNHLLIICEEFNHRYVFKTIGDEFFRSYFHNEKLYRIKHFVLKSMLVHDLSLNCVFFGFFFVQL